MTSEELKGWVGRTERREEILDVSRLRALAATIAPDEAIGPGSPLPPGWHWLFFNGMVPLHEVGTDGHPRRGGFLPPVALPRRMWAGGEVTFLEHLHAGDAAERSSEILSVEQKSGKQGQLVFVAVRHRVVQGARLAIEEVQNIVYRNPAPAGASPRQAASPGAAESVLWQVPYTTNEVELFRYSALTFNSHRIHYDKEYATQEEGYPALVVHGPLTATMMMHAVTRHARASQAGGPVLRQFVYRGVAPLFVHEAATISARRDPDGALAVMARKADGTDVMSARAEVHD